jgi:G-patch domain
MDAHAHLKSLGWQGHSLGRHQNGIKKPILISHKTNNLGVGAKEKKEKHADQWWLNAFDSALKDFGTGKQVGIAVASAITEIDNKLPDDSRPCSEDQCCQRWTIWEIRKGRRPSEYI